MIRFPVADAGAKRILNSALELMRSKILFAGIALELFSQLEDFRTHSEVAEKLNLHHDNTRYLLDALTAMDFLEKCKGLYKNTALSSKYLVRSSELYIGAYVMMYNSVSGIDSIDIVKCVKEGPERGNEGKKGLKAHSVYGDYTQMIKIGQKAGRASEISNIVASLPEFSGFKKMLDLGGGPGLIGMATVVKHPVMKGVIFDVPAVIEVAKESIKEYGLDDRMEVLAGDYLSDPIGGGYDFILASATLNFAKHDLGKMMKKIYRALAGDGVFMCISAGFTHERTRPQDMVIGWLPSFLQGLDFSLEQGEISAAALRNGFKSVHKQTVNTLMGELDIDVARK